MSTGRHVLQIFIHADRERVWEAITDPDFTRRYFHRTAIASTLAVGAPVRYVLPDGLDAVEGIVEVAERPSRLVMTWRVLYDAAMAEEPPSRVEWTLASMGDQLTRVTVVHGDLGRSPLTSVSVAAGWPWVLSGLKTVLETDAELPAVAVEDEDQADAATADPDGEQHRWHGVEANNAAWALLGATELTDDEGEDLLRRVYAAAYHWARAARRGPENEARAAYMIAKAHWKLGQADPALRYADRCLTATVSAGLGDFDLAYAHEIRARAFTLAGRGDEAAESWAAARAVPIADAEDRAIVEADFA